MFSAVKKYFLASPSAIASLRLNLKNRRTLEQGTEKGKLKIEG